MNLSILGILAMIDSYKFFLKGDIDMTNEHEKDIMLG